MELSIAQKMIAFFTDAGWDPDSSETVTQLIQEFLDNENLKIMKFDYVPGDDMSNPDLVP